MESPPRNVLADTGPLFSLLHVGDADHARAAQFSRAFTGLLITTWPVITEVCYLLGQSNRRGTGVLLGMIQDEHLAVADLDPQDVGYVRTLMAKYDTMDLADASLVAVGERQVANARPARLFPISHACAPSLYESFSAAVLAVVREWANSGTTPVMSRRLRALGRGAE